MQHGLLRAIALNLQNANRRQRRLALQVEGLPQLVKRGFGFVQVLLLFFRVDARFNLGLLNFKLGLVKIVFRRLQFGLVLGACGIFFGLLLRDLIHQLAVVRLLVDEVPHLRLPVKLHQQIALA